MPCSSSCAWSPCSTSCGGSGTTPGSAPTHPPLRPRTRWSRTLPATPSWTSSPGTSPTSLTTSSCASAEAQPGRCGLWTGDSVLSVPPGTLVRFPRGAMLRGIALQPSCHGETVTALDQRRRVNSMRQYELMVILDPELDDRTVAPSLDKFLTVVTKDKGTVDNIDIWGRRRLAYDIKKKS